MRPPFEVTYHLKGKHPQMVYVVDAADAAEARRKADVYFRCEVSNVPLLKKVTVKQRRFA